MLIDAVITWVDGSDPDHARKMSAYLPNGVDYKPTSYSIDRFETADELSYCLRSIIAYAPWINKVWIVTDRQQPPISDSISNNLKIEIVDHREIFGEFAYLLPTFSSVSIETFLWRITGLQENFLYFNDDMGFCGKAEPTDFFRGNRVILRGWWGTYAEDEQGIWQNNQVNAALMMGYGRDNFFRDRHQIKACKKSIFQDLFFRFRNEFERNASHRFRSASQFLPIGIHDHAVHLAGIPAKPPKRKDWVHFSLKNCRFDGADVIVPKLKQLASGEKTLYCINDLTQLKKRFPSCIEYLDRAMRVLPQA